jgi:hypothetical protein
VNVLPSQQEYFVFDAGHTRLHFASPPAVPPPLRLSPQSCITCYAPVQVIDDGHLSGIKTNESEIHVFAEAQLNTFDNS